MSEYEASFVEKLEEEIEVLNGVIKELRSENEKLHGQVDQFRRVMIGEEHYDE